MRFWTVGKGRWLVGNYGHEMSGDQRQRQFDSVQGNTKQVERDCALDRIGQRGKRAFSALKESVRSLERKPLPVNIYVVLEFPAICMLPIDTHNRKKREILGPTQLLPTK